MPTLTREERIDRAATAVLCGTAPPFKLKKDEAREVLDAMYIINGGGAVNGNVPPTDTQVCIMQATNLYAALVNGDEPEGARSRDLSYAHPDAWLPTYQNVDEVDTLLNNFLIAVNDSLNDEDDLQKLKAFVPRLLNTRVGAITSRRAVLLNEEATKWVARQAPLGFDDDVNGDVSDGLRESDVSSARRKVLWPYDHDSNIASARMNQREWRIAAKRYVDGFPATEIAEFLAERDPEFTLKLIDKLLRCRRPRGN